ncbi:MAG: DUF1868 domain-containing protein [Eubacteriales bacterium]|nr:DUF1868 domain-containing protein [Eubacteriales bacterium]
MINDTVYKFDKQCKPLPYYGNTLISYLNEIDQPIYKAAVRVQERIKNSKLSSNLAFLPVESFHMTVLTLCREIDRHTEYWPPSIHENARFSEVDKILKEIVDRIPFPDDIQMIVDECEINRIVLKPVDEDSRIKLADYRDEVARKTGITHSWHNTFRYHLSLDYLVIPLDEEQEAEKKIICKECTEWLTNEIKPFVVPKPDFVIFNDMMSYEKNLELRGNLY